MQPTEAQDKVRAALATGTKTTRELVALTGMSKHAVIGALHRMGIKGRRVGAQNDGMAWTLPKE